MAKAPNKPQTKTARTPGFENDIYTALLGLTLLIMSGTAVWACMRSMQLFGKIFQF